MRLGLGALGLWLLGPLVPWPFGALGRWCLWPLEKNDKANSMWHQHGPHSGDENTRKRFMAFVRGHVGRAPDAETQEVHHKFARTADAWDRLHGFRHGNKINRSIGGKREGEEDENKASKRRPHPNQWGFGKMMRMGFASIGRSTVGRKGIDGSTHTMAQISVTASVA